MHISTRLKNYLPYGWFTLLALSIIGPWLKPGYILTLDMVFTPRIPMPHTITSSYLFNALLHVLNYVFPSQVIEKIMLFLVFFLAGISMYRLLKTIHGTQGKYERIAWYLGGFVYTINPFTYDRLMAGQYAVLLGYALFPYCFRTLFLFIKKPTLLLSIQLAAWSIIISIVSIHTLGYIVLCGLFAALGYALCHRHKMQDLVRMLRLATVSIGIFVAASSYWLLPLLLGKGSTANQISQFTQADNTAFATQGTNAFEKVINVLHAQGFWFSAHGLYSTPQQQVHIWYILASLLGLLITLGVYTLWRTHRNTLLIYICSIFIASVFLASGIENNFLTAHIPFFAGYREPQKFVALIMLVYCMLLSFGALTFIKYCDHELGRLGITITKLLLFAVPCIMTATIFWGCRGQLTSRSYPKDWATANHFLDTQSGTFQTLFLPWHLYMYFGFAGRLIANPAPSYFNKPVIVSANPELGGATTGQATYPQMELSQYFTSRTPKNFTALLTRLDIQYVILDKENDYQSYQYLSHEPGFRLVQNDPTLMIYKNIDWNEHATR